MYHGKHEKPAAGMKKYKKSGILIASIVLILALTIGTTISFLMDTTGTVENIFNPTRVTTDIDEEFSNNKKSSVKLTNTGTIPAYIRATAALYWTVMEDGEEVLVPAPFNVTVDINEAGGWFEAGGIYYYANPVPVGEQTAELLETPVELFSIPAGYTFHMEVLGEAIQASPDEAVEAAWEDVSVSGGKLVAN